MKDRECITEEGHWKARLQYLDMFGKCHPAEIEASKIQYTPEGMLLILGCDGRGHCFPQGTWRVLVTTPIPEESDEC